MKRLQTFDSIYVTFQKKPNHMGRRAGGEGEVDYKGQSGMWRKGTLVYYDRALLVT